MSTPEEQVDGANSNAPESDVASGAGSDSASHSEPHAGAGAKGPQAAAAEAFADAENLGKTAPAAEGDGASEAPAEPPTPEELAAQVEALKAHIVAQQNDVLRAQADLENMRKRTQREVENAHKFGLEKMMNELLPVRDSLELGLGAAADEGVDVASVREGLELTLKMFNTATEKFGLVEVNPLEQAFDPDLHQAISMQEVEGAESGKVLNVVQKGFTLNDRLIRPAMVIVAK